MPNFDFCEFAAILANHNMAKMSAIMMLVFLSETSRDVHRGAN